MRTMAHVMSCREVIRAFDLSDQIENVSLGSAPFLPQKYFQWNSTELGAVTLPWCDIFSNTRVFHGKKINCALNMLRADILVIFQWNQIKNYHVIALKPNTVAGIFLLATFTLCFSIFAAILDEIRIWGSYPQCPLFRYLNDTGSCSD